MSNPHDNTDSDIRPDPTQARFLTPDICRVHLGNHGALHVTVMNERIYGGVYAAQAFPATYPDGYIALIHTVGEDKDLEIGVIRDLKEFPKADADLVREALARRYFIHTIMKFKSVTFKYGCVVMDVETDKGPASFMMRWSYDCAVDYGRRGKMLLDLDENRYLVPDVRKLPPRERNDFQRYIYW